MPAESSHSDSLSTFPSAAPAPSAQPPHNSVFYGPNGIRSGWRLMIFLVLAIATGTALI